MSSSVASLDGKCTLVTGAATGVGRAIAMALAAAGARVVVNHNHTPESAEKVAVAINTAGGTAMALAADVSRRAEYRREDPDLMRGAPQTVADLSLPGTVELTFARVRPGIRVAGGRRVRLGPGRGDGPLPAAAADP